MAKYGKLSAAREAGLFHPNCKHSISIFIEGISTKPKRPSADQIQKEKDLYKKKQQLNYINRQIAKWKNRRATAFEPKDVIFTKAKLQEWYKIRRDFMAANPEL